MYLAIGWRAIQGDAVMQVGLENLMHVLADMQRRVGCVAVFADADISSLLGRTVNFHLGVRVE